MTTPETSKAQSEAFNAIKAAIVDDPEYAWVWRCNLAMAAFTEPNVDLHAANRIAQSFMRTAFGVESTEPKPSQNATTS